MSLDCDVNTELKKLGQMLEKIGLKAVLRIRIRWKLQLDSDPTQKNLYLTNNKYNKFNANLLKNLHFFNIIKNSNQKTKNCE